MHRKHFLTVSFEYISTECPVEESLGWELAFVRKTQNRSSSFKPFQACWSNLFKSFGLEAALGGYARATASLALKHGGWTCTLSKFVHPSNFFLRYGTSINLWLRMCIDAAQLLNFCLPMGLAKDHRIAWSHPGPQPVTEFLQCPHFQDSPGRDPRNFDGWQIGWLIWWACEICQPRRCCNLPKWINTTCRVIPVVIQADFVEIKHMNSMLVPFWPDQSRCLRLSLTRLARWATVFLVCSLLRMSPSHSFSLHAWILEVLCDPDIAQLLLHADEAEKKAFSHWSKYQILVQKGRTPEGIRWLFMAVSLDWTYIGFWNVLSLKKTNFVRFRFCQLRFDGHEAGYLSSEKLSTRNLQAITCQALLAQKHLLQLILEKIDTDFTDYPAAIKDAACLKVLVPSFKIKHQIF